MDFLSFVVAVIFILVILAIALMILAYRTRHLQDAMLYQPGPRGAECDSPSTHGIPNTSWESLSIKCSDGVVVKGLLIRPTAATPPSSTRSSSPAQGSHNTSAASCTLVYFHGNAGNVGHRLPIARMLVKALRCNVVMVDYRGYGLSDAVAPTEEGLQLDAVAILEHVVGRIANEKIFLMGVSLGGAVVVHLASIPHYQRHISGIILENTFTSVSDMADALFTPIVQRGLPNASPYVLPLLKHVIKPIVLFIGWWSIDKIRKLTVPILLLSGSKDEIVPPVQMHRLYQAASQSKLKRFCDFDKGHHNDLCTKEGYTEHIGIFMKDALQSGALEVVTV